MKHYLKSAEAVFQEVNSNENGLSSAEAAARLEKNGKNKLAEAKKDSTLKKFFDQMKDPWDEMSLAEKVESLHKRLLAVEGGESDGS